MNIEVGGFFGFIILVLDIWAIVSVAQSGVSTGMKVFWIILVLLLPVVGFALWLVFGPKGR
jgi:Phospholipase_D-nuclease N-terminal